MNHPQCIRSGWCCKKAPCGFGEATSPTDNSCLHLIGDKAGEYSCGKYDEIAAGMPNNAAHISPAFGAGCCATLNDDRLALLAAEPTPSPLPTFMSERSEDIKDRERGAQPRTANPEPEEKQWR